MGKRKDHHRDIIKASMTGLPIGAKVIEFHTAQKMPRPLRGVPDLNIQWCNINFWIEIKPRYANYMRDQMSDIQWTWFHERFTNDCFGFNNRYAIVTDHDELIDFFYGNILNDITVWMPEYHWDRYDRWRKGR